MKILVLSFTLLIADFAFALDSKQCDLPQGYKYHAWLPVSELTIDIDSDTIEDRVNLISDTKTNKKGIAVCLSKSSKILIAGAGKDFGNGGDDFEWMDHWEARNSAIKTGKKEQNAIFVEKTESASALIYFKNGVLSWKQAGD